MAQPITATRTPPARTALEALPALAMEVLTATGRTVQVR